MVPRGSPRRVEKLWAGWAACKCCGANLPAGAAIATAAAHPVLHPHPVQLLGDHEAVQGAVVSERAGLQGLVDWEPWCCHAHSCWLASGCGLPCSV